MCLYTQWFIMISQNPKAFPTFFYMPARQTVSLSISADSALTTQAAHIAEPLKLSLHFTVHQEL